MLLIYAIPRCFVLSPLSSHGLGSQLQRTQQQGGRPSTYNQVPDRERTMYSPLIESP